MDPLLIANLAWILAVVVDFLIRIAALIIIPRDRKPSTAMAWLLCIFFIPYAGVIFFFAARQFQVPTETT